MNVEAPRSTTPNQETVKRGIEKDYYSLIPKLEQLPDETEISYLYRRKELTDLLKKNGLTPVQRRVIKNALGTVVYQCHEPMKLMTVGEIRRMTDSELLEQGRGRNRVGGKKLKILRALLGKIPDESDIPTPVETLSFHNLNEDELAEIKLELGERLLADWKHILNLPRVEIEDEAEPRRVEEIFNVLRFQGWTKGQLTAISDLLSEINQFTVGKLRNMSDEEILEIKGIGLKRWVTIRILFGQEKTKETTELAKSANFQ